MSWCSVRIIRRSNLKGVRISEAGLESQINFYKSSLWTLKTILLEEYHNDKEQVIMKQVIVSIKKYKGLL